MLRLKTGYYVLTLVLVAGFVANLHAAEKDQTAKEQKLLRHVVMFSFNDDATEDQITEIVKAFGELPKQIKTIHAYEWGTNNSPEGLNKTHTHCFLVTFKSEKDRDEYLPHPAHKEFVIKLKPILKDVTVIDYWASH
ncbi:MAG: Dabb family protein [Planctomicrobium sp.]|jgi:hypothetical protein|nr:Dabb family protein [Planctomicrobium sp.]